MAIVTREQARQIVVAKMTALQNSFTPFKLEIDWDNKDLVDLTKQQKPFMQFSMVYQDGEQVGMGKKVDTRVMGTLVIAVLARKGSGVSDSNKVIDHFFREMGRTDSMFPVRTYASRFSSSPSVNGWVSQASLIPFWYDTE